MERRLVRRVSVRARSMGAARARARSVSAWRRVSRRECWLRKRVSTATASRTAAVGTAARMAIWPARERVQRRRGLVGERCCTGLR